MSFGGGRTDSLASDKPVPLGIRAERTATQEFGRPVPYFAGIGMMSGTYISEPWAVRSEPVREKVGKKKQTTGYNYFCSFAMLFCLGPVDRLDEIWLDDELFWTGTISRGATDYADIAVAGFGTLRLYWGTETQVEDADMATSGTVHPAYRGQCYGVFKSWKLGKNRTNCPNVEIKIQRTPAVSWLTAAQEIDEDANPIAVLAEMLQSPRYGLGIGDDRLDTVRLEAAAGVLVTEGIGVSPLITNTSRFTQFVGKVLDHVDGFLTQDPTGLLGIELIRGIIGSPLALDETKITEQPAIESHLWWETMNEVQVKFTNRERYFETDAVSYRDRASFAIVGSTRTQQVNRDWITKQSVAWKVAAALARQLSLPYIEGTVRVRRDAAAGLAVGSPFLLTYAASGLNAVAMRITGLTIDRPDTPTVALRFQEERGYLNADFYVPGDVDPGTVVKYESADLYAAALLELPYGWTGRSDLIVALVASRNDVVSNGFLGWWERSPGSFLDVEDSDVFWLTGTTNGAFDISLPLEPDALLDITFGGSDKTLDAVTYDQALASPTQFIWLGDEILIPYDLTLVSAGRYTMKVLRARYGTLRATHASGAVARVVKLGGDAVIGTHEFDTPTTAVQTYKLQPYFMANGFDLSLCAEHTLTPRLVGLAPIPPANLIVNGDGVNPTYSTGGNITVDWDETSELRDTRPPEEILHSRAEVTVIEVLTTANVLKGTVRHTGAVGPAVIANGTLVGMLGSETDFKVRVRYEYAGVQSLTSVEITVWKV